MRTRLFAVAATASVLAAVVPLLAHHSLSAEFDTNRRITLKGPVTKMEWINPHVWLHMDVKDADGKVVSWMVEAGSPNSLIRRGLTKNVLPNGTEVVVQAYLSKTKPDSVAHGTTVLTPNGKELYLGASSDADPEK